MSARFFHDAKMRVLYSVPSVPDVTEQDFRNKPSGWLIQAQLQVVRADNFTDPNTNRWKLGTTELAREEYFIPQDTLETARGWFEQFKYLPLGEELDSATFNNLRNVYEVEIHKKSSELQVLHRTLLKIGGTTVDFENPKLTTEISNRGTLQKRSIIHIPGTPSKCHLDAAERWYSNEKSVIATGYVLIGKEWVQHSWNIEGHNIVENHSPVVNTKAYFGYELNPQESLKFLMIQAGQNYVAKKLAETHFTPPHILRLLTPSAEPR